MWSLNRNSSRVILCRAEECLVNVFSKSQKFKFFALSSECHFRFVKLCNCVIDEFSPIVGFPSGGGGNPITNPGGGGGGFRGAKNDLIAELKMSHTAGGVSKLRTEQQKMAEEQEREQYKRFLAQFTMENFLEKVSLFVDLRGREVARPPRKTFLSPSPALVL